MQQSNSSSANKRVLVVEDEQGTREFYETALQMGRFDVIAVASATEACELIDQAIAEGWMFDAIITDLMLGTNSPTGIELARDIREKDPGCLIVFVTGYDSDSLALPKELLNVSAVIKKPFESANIRQRMEKLLDMNSETTQPSSATIEPMSYEVKLPRAAWSVIAVMLMLQIVACLGMGFMLYRSSFTSEMIRDTHHHIMQNKDSGVGRW